MRFAPVILAGGSGTRFWPRSRRARAKQVLALDGESTMIQQTLERLLPVAAEKDVWVITNRLLAAVIGEQLPGVLPEHLVSEPAARNTAPACALTAFLLEAKGEADTVIGIFPSDHVVANIPRFAEVIRAGVALAAKGENIVVLGVPPTRIETGYGYVEQGQRVSLNGNISAEAVPAHRVKRFREKPDYTTAEKFIAAGNFAWNAGIFLWSAKTLAAAIREHAPEMAPRLEKIAAAHGIVKPGGRVVILDLLSHGFEQARELYADLWLGFTELEMLQMLEAAGFNRVEVTVVSREEQSPHLQTMLATGWKSSF